jgi:hypothetical protein
MPPSACGRKRAPTSGPMEAVKVRAWVDGNTDGVCSSPTRWPRLSRERTAAVSEVQPANTAGVMLAH